MLWSRPSAWEGVWIPKHEEPYDGVPLVVPECLLAPRHPAPDSFDYIYLHVEVGSLAGQGSAPPHHPGNPGGSQVTREHEADPGN